MNIEIDDFIIVQTEFSYELNKKVKSRKVGDGDTKNPTGEIYDNTVNYGYFSSVEFALLKIIQLNLLDNENTVSIGTFLNEYKKERDRVINILK